MINFKTNLCIVLALGLLTVEVSAQDHHHARPAQPADQSHANCPLMQPNQATAPTRAPGHSAHLDDVNARGERAMGFSQTATTHHFLLARDGGSIEVEVNEPEDAANREKIRQHLKHIAGMFSSGNFRIPMLVHDQVPPGVTTMEQRQGKLQFVYEETARGGRVRISTTDSVALAAVHEFLRFQITDHQTGDPLEVIRQ